MPIKKDLEKSNRELKEQNRALTSEVERLRDSTIALSTGLKRLLPICPGGHPANQWKWNSEQYIVSCGDPGCRQFQRPLPGGIKVKEFKKFQELARAYEPVRKEGEVKDGRKKNS